jgi:hypothetical protein
MWQRLGRDSACVPRLWTWSLLRHGYRLFPSSPPVSRGAHPVYLVPSVPGEPSRGTDTRSYGRMLRHRTCLPAVWQERAPPCHPTYAWQPCGTGGSRT